ncbi:MAG: MBL fold metallo-hydrolase [Candidatus Omnitrophica bacterium]|nr:MBL fold metallo-hydrolase [Candidatus Omnitrophota bacterium]
MKKTVILMILVLRLFCLQAFAEEVIVSPVNHASFVMRIGDFTFFVDPVEDTRLYSAYSVPDFILITDIHNDHLNKQVVDALKSPETVVIGPQAVIDILGYGEVLNNNEYKTFSGITFFAIPMYNLTKKRLYFHPKGRGNGYLIKTDANRIYISGDTEDIPEMRSLKRIDYAFICMNLPYTMSVEQAASAVLEFKPRVVYPYHYRGKDMDSDLYEFMALMKKAEDIEVRVLNWYR